jgi:hypothetical protein
MNTGGTMAYEHPVWKDFARSMVPLMIPAAEGSRHVRRAQARDEGADLAAGHGFSGLRSHGTTPMPKSMLWIGPGAGDSPRACWQPAADRWHAIEGSAFEVEFGGDYDVALITNFHHHFSPPTIETIMRKVHGALKPEGLAVTLEFVPNDDRVTPPEAASFSLMMLGTTEEGDAYTFAEYQTMFQNSLCP